MHAHTLFPRKQVVEHSPALFGLPHLNVPSWGYILMEKTKSSILLLWNWKLLKSTRVDLGDPLIPVRGNIKKSLWYNCPWRCKEQEAVSSLKHHGEDNDGPEWMRRPWLNFLKGKAPREWWSWWCWFAAAQGVQGDSDVEHLGIKSGLSRQWDLVPGWQCWAETSLHTAQLQLSEQAASRGHMRKASGSSRSVWLSASGAKLC